MAPSSLSGPALLRRFRKRRRWSMAAAARWYGVTLSAWSRWEAGHRAVPLPLLHRIAEAKKNGA